MKTTNNKAYFVIILVLSFQQVFGLDFLKNTVGSALTQSDDTIKTIQHSGFIPYGIVNIFYHSITSCQLAGIGNIAHESSTGFQCAGIFNTATTHQGLQLAGIINTSEESSGMQIGGIVNQTTQGNCAQIAGIINNSHKASGFQIAGLISHSKAKQTLQVSGLLNNAGESDFQLAAIMNNSSEEAGLQIAGIINNCDETTGSQIAGIVNRSPFFRGVQIGMINIADSCEGVPIGLVNIIKKNGYFTIELAGDEVFYTTVGLRSGLKKIHGIVVAGWQADNLKNMVWTVGTGIGSLYPLNNKTSLGVDMMYHQIFSGFCEGDNYMWKLNIGIDRQIVRKVSFYGGLSYNFLLTDNKHRKFDTVYDSIAPYYFMEIDNWHWNFKTWAGLKVCLRFL